MKFRHSVLDWAPYVWIRF